MEVFKSKGLECQLYNESEVEGIDGLDVVMFTGGGKISKQLKKLKSEIVNRILSKGEIDIVINIKGVNIYLLAVAEDYQDYHPDCIIDIVNQVCNLVIADEDISEESVGSGSFIASLTNVFNIIKKYMDKVIASGLPEMPTYKSAKDNSNVKNISEDLTDITEDEKDNQQKENKYNEYESKMKSWVEVCEEMNMQTENKVQPVDGIDAMFEKAEEVDTVRKEY